MSGSANNRLDRVFAPFTYTQVAFSFDVSLRILALGLGIAFLLGLIGGLAPAVRAARRPITAGLRGS